MSLFCAGLRRKRSTRRQRREKEVPRGEKVNTERLRNLKRELKALQKLEAGEKRGASRKQAEREIGLANEAATGLLRVCTDTVEARRRRYFTIVERPEIEENEFKLNLPR
jgi:hypothetical protein